MRARIASRCLVLSAIVAAAAALTAGPRASSGAVITLFNENGQVSFGNGVFTNGQSLDTTVADVGTKSWKIVHAAGTGTGSLGFNMLDNQAPLAAFDPANGATLTFRYLTTASNYRVKLSMDVYDNATSAFYTVLASTPDIVLNLTGDGAWHTASFTPAAANWGTASTIDQALNRTYRFRLNDWPYGSGWTQAAGDTINLDNIQISYNPPPVPEPASLSLLALGGLALLRRR